MRIIDMQLYTEGALYSDFRLAPPRALSECLGMIKSRAAAAHYRALDGDFNADLPRYVDWLTLIVDDGRASVADMLGYLSCFDDTRY